MTTKRIILSTLVFFSLTSACVYVDCESPTSMGDLESTDSTEDTDSTDGTEGMDMKEVEGPQEWSFAGCCHCDGQTAECDPWSSSAEGLCIASSEIYGEFTWIDFNCIEIDNEVICPWSKLICSSNL